MPSARPSSPGPVPASPRAQLEHALLLIARMNSGDPRTADTAREALARWRAAHPDHEIAYGTARAGWDATSADALRGDVPVPPTYQERLRAGRRKALSVLGLGALLVGTGALARWHWRQPLHELALGTERGQIRTATLPDGSGLAVDARTRLRIALYRDRREAWLDEGEARFSVASDASRPFVVVTPFGRVRVLGTVFTVEARHDRMRVAVAEGRVAVWAGALPVGGVSATLVEPAQTVLEAGQAVLTQDGALASVHSVQAGQVGAWRQGWLVFDNTALPEAVARWNDYLNAPLHLADEPALRRLRLTGSFPVRSPSAFVEALPGILPVRTERAADGSVRILARR
jgi:transmembrane sensor